jgi:hypothetical protein
MTKEYFKASSINMDDPDNLEIFSLASTVNGNLIAKELAPGIHVVSNALDQRELDYLNKLCREATQEDWEVFSKNWDYSNDEDGTVAETYQNYWADKSLEIVNKSLCKRLVEKIRPFFGDGYDLPVFGEVHRQKIGEGMDQHHDMGSRSDLLRSMLFYLNDDYEGGELYFPALDFEYKPKAGDFITFPSYRKYTHGVRPVLSGSNRYVISNFAWASGKLPSGL